MGPYTPKQRNLKTNEKVYSCWMASESAHPQSVPGVLKRSESGHRLVTRFVSLLRILRPAHAEGSWEHSADFPRSKTSWHTLVVAEKCNKNVIIITTTQNNNCYASKHEELATEKLSVLNEPENLPSIGETGVGCYTCCISVIGGHC